MNLHFIGTGSGKTSLNRNHSSLLLSAGNHSILIDAGDGTAKALLSQNININSIGSILFTHYHADHFSGIASLITQMKLTDRNEPMKIFTHSKLISPLKTFLNTCYLFDEKIGFEFNITGFNEDQKYIINDEINFIPKKNSHILKSDILNNYTDVNFISCSFMFNAGDKKIIYTSDIGSKEDLYLFSEEKADIFITETSHVSTDQIYNFYIENNPDRLFLTHISDEDEEQILNFIEKLNPRDKEKIFSASDNLILTL